MKNFSLRTAALVPVVALVLAACGGGDEESAPTSKGAYVDAMTSTWSQNEQISEAQARCWSNKFVDTVGMERLRNHGAASTVAVTVGRLDYTALGFTQKEGNEVFDHFTDCGMDLRSTVVEGFLGADEVPAEARACITERLDDARVRDFTVTMMVQGQEEAESGMEADLQDPESMGAVVVECAYGIDVAQLLETETG